LSLSLPFSRIAGVTAVPKVMRGKKGEGGGVWEKARKLGEGSSHQMPALHPALSMIVIAKRERKKEKRKESRRIRGISRFVGVCENQFPLPDSELGALPIFTI